MAFLPIAFLPLVRGGWETDVARGISSVELELVSPPAPKEGEEFSVPIHPVSPPAESMLDEGVTVDWKDLALKNQPPHYPMTARIQGWQGTVFVRARVLESGRAGEVKVQQSSGFELLDRAAVESVQKWMFRPVGRGGRHEAAWVEIPIVFRLKSKE